MTENLHTEESSDDLRIRQEILTALHQHPKIDESKMLVEVNNATVVLKGKADTEEEKEHAQLIAAAVAGVKHVENHLHVEAGIVHALTSLAAQLSGDPEKEKNKDKDHPKT